MTLTPGKRLGPYEILSVIGTGGPLPALGAHPSLGAIAPTPRRGDANRRVVFSVPSDWRGRVDVMPDGEHAVMIRGGLIYSDTSSDKGR